MARQMTSSDIREASTSTLERRFALLDGARYVNDRTGHDTPADLLRELEEVDAELERRAPGLNL